MANDRLKRFIETNDWRLYSAIAASVVFAGIGVYYLSSSSAPPETSEKPGDTTQQSDNTATIDYETLSPEAIAKLTTKQRAAAAQTLKTKGNNLFGKKNWKEAARFYTKALEYKADPVYYSNRAACYANLGDNDQVFDDCNQALRLNPVYIKALNRRAHALELRGDLEESLYDYTSVCILDGFKNEVAAKSMERLMKKVSEQKALDLMKTKEPRLPSSTFVSAYFDSYRPDRSRPEPIADGGAGDEYFVRACDAMKSKNYDEASKSCDKAVELGCSSAYQAHALNLKGTFSFLKGNAKEALECFDKSIELDPKYVQSYIKRSSIYMELGELPATLNQFEQAIAINPSDADIYYHRGQVKYISGDYQGAAKDYTESIKLDDSFVYAHIQLGVVQYKLGSNDLSMSTFENALAKFEKSAEIHNYFGELLADQQKLAEALEMFTSATVLDPNGPMPYINKAMLTYQGIGDADEAIRLCKRALEVDPACDAAVASLAQILLEQGRPTEALHYYEMAIQLARTAAEIEQAISYVEATKAQIRFAKEYPQAAQSLNKLRGL